MIIDIVDNLSVFPYQYKKRKNLYNKNKFKLNFYHAIDDNIVPYSEILCWTDNKDNYIIKQKNNMDDAILQDIITDIECLPSKKKKRYSIIK